MSGLGKSHFSGAEGQMGDENVSKCGILFLKPLSWNFVHLLATVIHCRSNWKLYEKGQKAIAPV